MNHRIIKSHLHLAIKGILVGIPCFTGFVVSSAVYADTMTLPYTIAASSLSNVLKAFAIQSHLTLAYEPQNLSQQQSAGLNGHYTIEQALKILLEPHGLEALKLSNGGYSIQQIKRSNEQSQNKNQEVLRLKPIIVTAEAKTNSSNTHRTSSHELPTIVVNAEKIKDPTTEGTGSYTTKATSAATGLTLSLKETPQLVSVYTAQQLKDEGLTQLMDVAQVAAGLAVSSSGGYGSDSSPIYSRGFQVNNYLLDGVKLLNSYSSIYQSQDNAIFDRVEVVRGSTGLMTGAGSPSASINLVRKKPFADQRTSISVTGGRWDYGRLETDVSSPLNADGSIRGRIVMAVQKNGSYIDHLKEERKVFYAVVEGDITDKTTSSLAISHTEINLEGSSRTGNPAWFRDGTRASWSRSKTASANWAYSDRSNTGIFFDLSHQFNQNWSVKTSLSRIINSSDELIGQLYGTPYLADGSGMTLYASRWNYRPVQDVFSTNLNGKFELFGQQHEMVVGTTLAQNKNPQRDSYSWNTTSDSSWSPVVSSIYTWDGSQISRPLLTATGWYAQEVKDYSAFAAFRFKLHDRLALLTGARVEDWKTNNTSYSKSSNTTSYDKRQETGEVTPYVGLVFDFNPNWSIYSSYTTIFQPQNYKDINSKVIEPLSGTSVELGLKGAFYNDAFNIGAALYKNKQDNVASVIYDSNGNAVTNSSGETLYQALEGTTSKGIEIEASGQLLPNWQVSTSFSRNISTDRTNAKINTTVPQNTARLFTSYVLPQFNQALKIGGGIRWQNEIYLLNSGANKVKLTQPAYALIDLMAHYEFNQHLVGSLNLNNVFDKKYYTTVGNSYYGEPVNVKVGLTYNW